MLNFIAWYLLVTLLGWVTFPLAFRLFPALTDRGFILSRALGLLVWGYAFWLLVSLGVLQNNGGGLFAALLLLAVISAWGLWRRGKRDTLAVWIGANRRLIIVTEILFFLAFAAWAFVRASNPNIETAGGEKTMELAFINAILRSPTFPPHDPWLSGYAISYYYFGYVMTAMLAKSTGTLGSVAHNLMSALVFALSFIGAYGILYDLLGAWRRRGGEVEQPEPPRHSSLYALPLLGPLFLLFVSNLEAFLYLLYEKGIFWTTTSAGQKVSAFWSWLGILQLQDPPGGYINWWWRASRVIQDIDLLGNGTEIIDEFPAFSYLLGDLHPHVLAMPFLLLAVSVAVNLFLGGWNGETDLYLFKLRVRPAGFLFSALLLGGLAFLNTWDILTGFALIAGAYVLNRVRADGWGWRRLEEVLSFCFPVGIIAILVYLPFYLGFSSQAGGILPNLVSPTRGAHLWVFFGPFFVVLFPFILYLWRSKRVPTRWKVGFGIAAGFAFLLWVVSWLLAFLALKLQPAFAQSLLNSQCSGSVALCFKLATLRRLSYIGGLLTLLCLLGPALAFLMPVDSAGLPRSTASQDPLPVVMLMLLAGGVLVLAPDFVFLRDLFSYRLNTVFKFYFQAWILWSLAAAFGAAILLQNLRRLPGWLFRAAFVIVIAMSLAFPFMGLPEKTNGFQFSTFKARLNAARSSGDPRALQQALGVWTLDGARLFQAQYPDDAAAADWLSTAPLGVLAEATAQNSSYSDYAHIAVYSGQPAVLGWWWHEYQWRGDLAVQYSPLTNLACTANFNVTSGVRSRADDLACLYQSNNWQDAAEVIQAYHIRYVVVGTLERQTYRVSEAKFKAHMSLVFQSGDVTVYEIPQEGSIIAPDSGE